MAVSKLKPVNDILALARPGDQDAAAAATGTVIEPQLHFGENYAQELAQKAEMLPRDIRWHFIGGLQSGELKMPAHISIFISIYLSVCLSIYLSYSSVCRAQSMCLS